MKKFCAVWGRQWVGGIRSTVPFILQLHMGKLAGALQESLELTGCRLTQIQEQSCP